MESEQSFNLDIYKNLLSSLLGKGYEFIGFNKERIKNGRLSILLRHDIDADLWAALEMAKLEASLGIASTYFIMLRSPVYNLLSRHNQDFVHEIIALGHDIGLHYDQGYKPATNKSHEELIQDECRMLEEILNVSIKSVSFHQPGGAVLQGQVSVGDKINTYDRSLLEGFQYFSDSNRVFGFREHLSAMNTEEENSQQSYQVLIHPIWWVYDDKTTFDVWDRAIKTNLELMQKQMLLTERAYGERRKFSID